MSEPGGSDGFTRLGNALLDAMIRYPFTKRQLTILLALLRKTSGYNKTADDLSTRQLAEMTRINQADCSRTLGELARLGVIVKDRGEFGQLLRVVERPDRWNVGLPSQPPAAGLSVVGEGDGVSPSGVLAIHDPDDGDSPSEVMAIRHRADGDSPSAAMAKHHQQNTTPKDNTHTPSARTRARPPDTTWQRAVKTPLPAGFGLSDRVRQWADRKGFGLVEEHFEAFCSKARANGYTYADWDAALMNAIREDWAKLRAGPQLSAHPTRSAHETSAPIRSAVDRVRASGEHYLQQRDGGSVIDIDDYRPV